MARSNFLRTPTGSTVATATTADSRTSTTTGTTTATTTSPVVPWECLKEMRHHAGVAFLFQ